MAAELPGAVVLWTRGHPAHTLAVGLGFVGAELTHAMLGRAPHRYTSVWDVGLRKERARYPRNSILLTFADDSLYLVSVGGQLNSRSVLKLEVAAERL